MLAFGPIFLTHNFIVVKFFFPFFYFLTLLSNIFKLIINFSLPPDLLVNFCHKSLLEAKKTAPKTQVKYHNILLNYPNLPKYILPSAKLSPDPA
jgi:hypothetical protein